MCATTDGACETQRCPADQDRLESWDRGLVDIRKVLGCPRPWVTRPAARRCRTHLISTKCNSSTKRRTPHRESLLHHYVPFVHLDGAGDMTSILGATSRIVALAHERDAIVLPVAAMVVIIGLTMLGRWAYLTSRRFSAERRVIRVAIVAPWVAPPQLTAVLQGVARELETEATLVTVPSALELYRRIEEKLPTTQPEMVLGASALVRLARVVEREAMSLLLLRMRRAPSASQTLAPLQAVLLCAGGAVDAEAMCESKVSWSHVWRKTGFRRSALRARYDAVLVVTSRFAPMDLEAGVSDDLDAAAVRAAQVADDLQLAARRAAAWMGHRRATSVPSLEAVELADRVRTLIAQRRRSAGRTAPPRRGDDAEEGQPLADTIQKKQR
jgi:hypothetical protein